MLVHYTMHNEGNPSVRFCNFLSLTEFYFYVEEADTDLETDRLLGQQRTDDQGFYDDKVSLTEKLNRKIIKAIIYRMYPTPVYFSITFIVRIKMLNIKLL